MTTPKPPCIGNDPLCPCQDGDACHYKDAGKTKAWPVRPKLPEPDHGYHARTGYTADQLRAYAAECVAAERSRCINIVESFEASIGNSSVLRDVREAIRAGGA
jgi:hypothetical protein